VSTFRGLAKRRWGGAPWAIALPLPALGIIAIAACTPTVQMAAPKDPITINLNIKLDAEVRLRVEQKAKEDVKTKPIF
jgi:hypothetical protein